MIWRAQARAVRRIFDSADCRDLQIILSGGLDEHRIERMLAAGTPVDAFGVGTNLDVSTDAPALDMAYKLQEYAGRARRKRSPGKATWPGCKQVFRAYDAVGAPIGDCIALVDEPIAGTPLLREIMRAGRRVVDLPQLPRSPRLLPRATQHLAASAAIARGGRRRRVTLPCAPLERHSQPGATPSTHLKIKGLSGGRVRFVSKLAVSLLRGAISSDASGTASAVRLALPGGRTANAHVASSYLGRRRFPREMSTFEVRRFFTLQSEDRHLLRRRFRSRAR